MTASASASQHSSHPAQRLTVFLSPRDRVGHRPLMFELLRRIRRSKLVGVTVFKGQRGQGHSGRLHESRLLFDDAPLSLVIIERCELIDAFLSEIDDLIREVFVVVDDIDVVEM